ncbi:unnamed protein product [Calypogeia fissa]
MDEEKMKVLALAVHALSSMIEYAVVMAVQYMEIIGDDSVFDQVRQGCMSILAQLDAIQASAIFHNKRKRKRKVKFRPGKRVLDLDWCTIRRDPSEDTYQQMFKMDMSTFHWFCEQVGPHVERMNTNYKRSIPVTTRVAVAVFRLATGANYLIAAERFSVGESTVFYCTMELCQILCNHFKHMVACPQGGALRKVMAGFEAISGLPNCVGAIDCMHLRIKRPAGPQGADYLNEDKVYTIVTQAAVDATTRVLSLATGFTGAVPDLSVLELSSLYDNKQSGRFFNVPPVHIEGVKIPPYLVGDSNYQLKPWLIVPFPNVESTAVEDIFNRWHFQMWQRVDKTFKALKSWGILSGVLQVDVPTAIYMIGAVCIMHNILLEKSDPSKEGTWEEDFMLETSMHEPPVPLYPEREVTGNPQYAKAIRDALATYLITM